jgi:subtilisin family serine protease
LNFFQQKVSPELNAVIGDFDEGKFEMMRLHSNTLSLSFNEKQRIANVGILFKYKNVRKSLSKPANLSRTILINSGRIRTASIPLDEIKYLIQDENVEYVYPSIKLKPMLDLIPREIGLPAALKRAPGLDGSGVIIGVIDSGLDWSHPDFFIERYGEKISRILYLWDQTLPGAGADKFDYGIVYNNKQITDALNGNGIVLSNDTVGHGTHV